jgi:peptide deformylase
MTTLTKEDIITLPHVSLRKRSDRVHVITDETLDLIDNMTTACLDWETAHPHEVAVALAAVQVDRLERVVIVRADFDDKQNKEFITLINPEITKTEGTPTIIQPEGCLSVRNLYGDVPRYPHVRVKATDINGQEVRIRASGFLSMLFQHEIDHTKGICFVDHIKDQKDAFYTLTDRGELEPMDYADVEATGIFR